jgi:dTMP kinase
MFITLEGIEGSGKSLQIGRIEAYLKQRGILCLVTREPGGTAFGAEVRKLLLDEAGPAREPISELLLYLADRYQHLRERIEPALGRGVTVLSDRYHDATLAYQGAARRIPTATIQGLAQLLKIPEPDRTILLDLEPELGLARARNRNQASVFLGSEGRFEAENISFHRDVRAAYLALAASAPGRMFVIDGSGTPPEVFGRIEPLLAAWFDPASH